MPTDHGPCNMVVNLQPFVTERDSDETIATNAGCSKL